MTKALYDAEKPRHVTVPTVTFILGIVIGVGIGASLIKPTRPTHPEEAQSPRKEVDDSENVALIRQKLAQQYVQEALRLARKDNAERCAGEEIRYRHDLLRNPQPSYEYGSKSDWDRYNRLAETIADRRVRVEQQIEADYEARVRTIYAAYSKRVGSGGQ